MKIYEFTLNTFILILLVITISIDSSYSDEQPSTEGIRKAATKSLINLLCDEDFVECVGLDISHCMAAIENSFQSCWESEELAECVTGHIQSNTGINMSAYHHCKSSKTLESE